MKTSIKLFALGMILMGFGVNVNAQSTATATSAATIVTPILIDKVTDMNFGNVAVTGTGGTVILTPGSTRSTTGGTTLPIIGGTIAAASFTVTGEAGYTYGITLPTYGAGLGLILNNQRSGHTSETMIVNAFTSTPTPTGTLNGTGSQVLNVGATLNVSAGQGMGTYLSGTPFQVTVNYN